MRQRLSARTEQAIGTWQVVAEELIREPVRDAVREALEEEEIGRRSTAGRRSDGGSRQKGRTVLRPKVVVPLLGLVAAMFYARRRRSAGEGMTEEMTAGTGERAATTAGPSTGGTERGATEDAAGGRGGQEQEGDVEESDEEATARS